MRPPLAASLVAVTLLAGPADGRSLRLTPEQAVMNAAAVAPQGVTGVFEMPVRATGRQDGRIYLNSERDYRDQRNLSVEIVPAVAAQLTLRFGQSPDTYLHRRVIAVRGTARRVRIDFLDPSRRPTGAYYYQTQLRLMRASDLTVAGEPPAI